MGRLRIPAIAIGCAALLVLAGCSSDDGPSVILPSSAFPIDTGSPIPPGTGATGSVPTGPTGISTGSTGDKGSLAGGQAAVTTTGDVRASQAMTDLISSVYSAPPGGMALVWTAGGTNASTLGLGGLSFTGTQPTSPSLSLTLVVQTQDGIFSFDSLAGECVVTIGVATQDRIAGAFTCSGLRADGGEIVGASGSFTAGG
jgi:hypothetical protein